MGVNITTRLDLALRVPRGPFRVHKKMNTNIMVIKLVPGFDDRCVMGIVTQSSTLRGHGISPACTAAAMGEISVSIRCCRRSNASAPPFCVKVPPILVARSIVFDSSVVRAIVRRKRSPERRQEPALPCRHGRSGLLRCWLSVGFPCPSRQLSDGTHNRD